MKSTSFCLNYASSVSFLNFSKGKKCLVLCYGFRVSSQPPVLLPKPPTLVPTHPSWVSSFETFVPGRRKGSFVKADLIN